mmetsp:Transcript_12889/g.26122  ORF Transcript_12889/g.26122 Transcript_12889/m.26122 type:complete len:81 (+) Transcript_12889:1254-1496(+)
MDEIKPGPEWDGEAANSATGVVDRTLRRYLAKSQQYDSRAHVENIAPLCNLFGLRNLIFGRLGIIPLLPRVGQSAWHSQY